MPHLSTSPYFKSKEGSSLLSLISRWSLLVAMALPLSACDPGEAQDDDDTESSDDDDKDDDKEDKDDDKEDKDDKDGDDKEDKDDKDETGSTTGEEETDSTTGEAETTSTGGEDTSDDSDGNTGDNTKPKRDCSKIKWGSSLEEGKVVPESTDQGFKDSDGDNKADDEETEVGMCTLHKSGAKCGLILTGFLG